MLAISARSSRSCRGGGTGGLFDLVARKYSSELASVTNLLVLKTIFCRWSRDFCVYCFVFVWARGLPPPRPRFVETILDWATRPSRQPTATPGLCPTTGYTSTAVAATSCTSAGPLPPLQQNQCRQPAATPACVSRWSRHLLHLSGPPRPRSRGRAGCLPQPPALSSDGVRCSCSVPTDYFALR